MITDKKKISSEEYSQKLDFVYVCACTQGSHDPFEMTMQRCHLGTMSWKSDKHLFVLDQLEDSACVHMTRVFSTYVILPLTFMHIQRYIARWIKIRTKQS